MVRDDDESDSMFLLSLSPVLLWLCLLSLLNVATTLYKTVRPVHSTGMYSNESKYPRETRGVPSIFLPIKSCSLSLLYISLHQSLSYRFYHYCQHYLCPRHLGFSIFVVMVCVVGWIIVVYYILRRCYTRLCEKWFISTCMYSNKMKNPKVYVCNLAHLACHQVI